MNQYPIAGMFRYQGDDKVFERTWKADGEAVTISGSMEISIENPTRKPCCNSPCIFNWLWIRWYGLPWPKRLWLWIKTRKWPDVEGCGCPVKTKAVQVAIRIAWMYWRKA